MSIFDFLIEDDVAPTQTVSPKQGGGMFDFLIATADTTTAPLSPPVAPAVSPPSSTQALPPALAAALGVPEGTQIPLEPAMDTALAPTPLGPDLPAEAITQPLRGFQKKGDLALGNVISGLTAGYVRPEYTGEAEGVLENTLAGAGHLAGTLAGPFKALQPIMKGLGAARMAAPAAFGLIGAAGPDQTLEERVKNFGVGAGTVAGAGVAGGLVRKAGASLAAKSKLGNFMVEELAEAPYWATVGAAVAPEGQRLEEGIVGALFGTGFAGMRARGWTKQKARTKKTAFVKAVERGEAPAALKEMEKAGVPKPIIERIKEKLPKERAAKAKTEKIAAREQEIAAREASGEIDASQARAGRATLGRLKGEKPVPEYEKVAKKKDIITDDTPLEVKKPAPKKAIPPPPPKVDREHYKGRNIYKMSESDLEIAIKEQTRSDKNIDVEILGAVDAARYKKAHAEANRSSDAWYAKGAKDRGKKAQKVIDEIEGKLTPKQVDKLYGIGEPGAGIDEMRDVLRGLEKINAPRTVDDLAFDLQWALTELPKHKDFSKMRGSEKLAVAQFAKAHSFAKELGFSTKELSEATIRKAGARFKDPQDKIEMIGRFLSPEKPTPAPKKVAPKVEVKPKAVETPKPPKELTIKEDKGILRSEVGGVDNATAQVAKIVGQATDMKDLGVGRYIGTPANQLARIVSPPEHRWTRKNPVNDVILTADDIHIEYSRNDQLDFRMKNRLPKAYKGKNEAKFWDLYQSKGHKGIKDDPAIPKEVKAVAKHFNEKFEGERDIIVRTMRERIEPSIRAEIEASVRKEHKLEGKKLAGTKAEKEINDKVNAQLDKDVPSDWGVENYLPHIHPGNFRISHKGEYVTRATTRIEAIREINRHMKEKGAKPEDYKVDVDLFQDPDVVRLSRARYHKIMQELSESAGIDAGDIRASASGILGTKEGRRKYAGFMQKRTDAPGYRKDLELALRVHNKTFSRWRHLTALNARIQPEITRLRREGLTRAADELESMFKGLWGKRDSLAEAVDITLQKAPGAKWFVKPYFMERWSGRLRNMSNILVLKTLRFHTLNNLQTMQTVWPVTSAKELAIGWKDLYTKEGKATLERHGITFEYGKYDEPKRFGRVKEKFAIAKIRVSPVESERRNIAVSFLTLYNKGRSMGMSDKAAGDYGKLRGVVYTQFMNPGGIDAPQWMRSAGGKAAIQYKRFPLKNAELGIDLVKNGDYPGFSKWLAANALVGGASTYLRVAGAMTGGYLTQQTYTKIKDEYGETIANFILYGLPGLAGADFSRSVGLIDVPYGESVAAKIGNVVTPPSFQIAEGVIKGAGKLLQDKPLSKKGREAWDALVAQTPSLKQVEGIRKVYTGDYDFRDKNGKLKFKGDLKDAILQSGAFRSLSEEAVTRMVDAQYALEAERRKTIINIAAYEEAGDTEKAEKTLRRWEALWPEIPITKKDIKRKRKYEEKGKEKTRVERTSVKKEIRTLFSPPIKDMEEKRNPRRRKRKKRLWAP